MSRRRPAPSTRTVALVALAGAGTLAIVLTLVSLFFTRAASGEDQGAADLGRAAGAPVVASFDVAPRELGASPLEPPTLTAPVLPLEPLEPPQSAPEVRAGRTREHHPALQLTAYVSATTGETLADALSKRQTPLPPLAVVASDAAIDPATLEAPGSERGQYEPLPCDPQQNGLLGRVEIEAPMARFASLVTGRTVLATVELAPTSDSVDFRVDAERLLSLLGSVRYELTQAASGEGLLSCTSTLTGRDPWTGRSFTRTTAVGGEVSFEGLPPGPAVIALEGKGIERRVLEVEVPAGSTLDLGTLALSPWVTISGYVHDPFGTVGETEIEIHLAAPTGALASETPVSTGRANADGFFVLSALGNDRYVLTARKGKTFGPGRSSSLRLARVPIDTRAGKLSGLRIELVRPSLVSFGHPAGPRDDLILSLPDGTVIATWLAADRPTERRTHLAPGSYRLAVARDGQVVHERDVHIDERTHTIEVLP